jgi:hypothetical protein
LLPGNGLGVRLPSEHAEQKRYRRPNGSTDADHYDPDCNRPRHPSYVGPGSSNLPGARSHLFDLRRRVGSNACEHRLAGDSPAGWRGNQAGRLRNDGFDSRRARRIVKCRHWRLDHIRQVSSCRPPRQHRPRVERPAQTPVPSVLLEPCVQPEIGSETAIFGHRPCATCASSRRLPSNRFGGQTPEAELGVGLRLEPAATLASPLHLRDGGHIPTLAHTPRADEDRAGAFFQRSRCGQGDSSEVRGGLVLTGGVRGAYGAYLNGAAASACRFVRARRPLHRPSSHL